MGRSALSVSRRRPENRVGGYDVDRDALLDDIRALIETPIDREAADARARVERILTDGYAHALVLEGERLQIERAIGAVTARLGRGESNGAAGELSELSQRLSRTDGMLSELRALLASLRDRLRR
jgi:hypothetical protein